MRHNSAVSRLHVFYLVSSAMAEEKYHKRKATVMIFAVFFNVKLYLYQETISLTQKVLALKRKVEIKTSTSFEN